MNKLIIYPQASGSIAEVWPTGELSIEETAKKDVPPGTPYRIVSWSDMPTSFAFRDAWEADFSNPDGYGMGPEAWSSQRKTEAN